MLAVSLLLAGCSSVPERSDSATRQLDVTPELQADYQKAITLMQEHEWLAAQQRLTPITASHPHLSGPWLNLGITQLQLGEGSAAEAAFKQALAANPGNVEACNQLGILYRRADRLEEARRLYEAALLHDPDYADAHWNLGILHDQYLPNPQLALQHYERYQAITGTSDPQLQAWIDDLRVLTRAGNMTAKVKP
jgi:tetratricopeptide (TPR) repeat protein